MYLTLSCTHCSICIHMYPHELILSEQCRKRVRPAKACHILPHQYAVGHSGRVIPTYVRNLGKAYAPESNFTFEEDEKKWKRRRNWGFISFFIHKRACTRHETTSRMKLQLEQIDNDLQDKSKWNIPPKETDMIFCY